MTTRKYELKRRAERQEQTRLRIVEATISLHETVGAAGATISAIAARAGVERPTVYRHFPDERTLLSACTSHYLDLNAPPDPAGWREITDPRERLQLALARVYAFHRQTKQMMVHAMMDMETVPTLREVLAPFFEYWEMVSETLLAGWPSDGDIGRRLRAVIGHALDFRTWRSLTEDQGLDDDEVVELMVSLVATVACNAGGTDVPPAFDRESGIP